LPYFFCDEEGKAEVLVVFPDMSAIIAEVKEQGAKASSKL
jgi:hypothetical protein